jgi:hypothetical protein
MEKITKTIFETNLTISKLIEEITLRGLIAESKTIWVDPEPISLTKDQIKWIDEFVSMDKKIIHLKGDLQSGRTSIGLGMVLATALFQDKSTSMVLASNVHMSLSHYRKIEDFLRTFCEIFSLPELIIQRNKDSITLANGSKILFQRNKSCALRGIKLDSLFFDLFNTPSMESLDDELMCSALPCIAYSGKLIVSIGP